MSKVHLYFIFTALFFVLNSFGQNDKVIYKKINDSVSLDFKLIQPTNLPTGKTPCAIFLSGGGWMDFDWTQLEQLAYALSDRGILSVIVEYRTKKKHNSSPFDALVDVKDAIARLRENSETLNIDKEKIIAIGISAGGHLAFSSYFVDTVDGVTYGEESKPNYIVGLSPVIRNDSIGFGYDVIGENYKWFSPYHNYLNTEAHLPPSVIISGEEDELIKFEHLEEFYKKSIEKKDDLLLYNALCVGHSMKTTYRSIYSQSFPIIISFLADNEVISNSEIINPIKYETNVLRNSLIALGVLLLFVVVGHLFRKKLKKGHV